MSKNLQQNKQKAALLEQLTKIPIVQLAVQKVGISRASYYLWRKQDSGFAKASDQAISEGVLFINDLAEGKLVSLIDGEDIQSIRFWLTHRHPAYASKLQINATVNSDEPMNNEQKRFVEQAIRQLELKAVTKVGKNEND